MTESELRLELRGLVEKWEETAQETWALADRCANVRDSVGLWSEANTLNACAADLAAILDKHADTSAAESSVAEKDTVKDNG